MDTEMKEKEFKVLCHCNISLTEQLMKRWQWQGGGSDYYERKSVHCSPRNNQYTHNSLTFN